MKYRSRHLFVRLLIWLYAKKRITRAQLRTMWRGMDDYMMANINTPPTGWPFIQPSPAVQRLMRKSFLLMLIWAAYRLAVEQPLVFVAGLLCILPSIPITLYWVLRMVGICT